ncbi:transporter associated domain-containing protein [Porticoccus sp. W117]|uniref:HlyC/CorC family transporter n=1 Tax=Porticoccus sp. W117 TaxID=3054777 RepID=UPI0025989C6B|nr:transporter associated domain-containing protein [Porticoccus sp. W117]MDM3872480.1 transporter associated domain-containing protein [Porticoccus sp. W117]
MSDDIDSSHQDNKSWLDKLTNAFSSDPETREELLEVLHEAHNNKIIDSEALEIIEGALEVSEQQVRDIMIPRSQMVAIEYDQTPEEFLPVVIESGHSRFPVVGESHDDIRGVLLAKELLPLLLKDSDEFDMADLVRPATIIPESKRLNVLLKEFREQRYHMAMVVDEYGTVSGLVTIEDVLEEIVGEIEDETDEEEVAQIRPQENGSFLVEALTPIEEFNEHFDASLDEEEYDTIGGIVMQAFGRLPSEGEQVQVDGFSFSVVKGDGRRIHLLELAAS